MTIMAIGMLFPLQPGRKIGKHILLLHGATYSIKLPKKKFSLIIADYRLRNETIIELLDYMKREKIFIPIIVVSADDDEQYKEKALDAGATAFYDKFSLNLSKIYALLDDFQ